MGGGRYPNQPEIVRLGPSLIMVTPKVVAKMFGIGPRKALNLARELGVPIKKIGDSVYVSQQALETAMFTLMLPDAVRASKNPELAAYLQELHALQFCFVSQNEVINRLKKIGEVVRREVRKQSDKRLIHPNVESYDG